MTGLFQISADQCSFSPAVVAIFLSFPFSAIHASATVTDCEYRSIRSSTLRRTVADTAASVRLSQRYTPSESLCTKTFGKDSPAFGSAFASRVGSCSARALATSGGFPPARSDGTQCPMFNSCAAALPRLINSLASGRVIATQCSGPDTRPAPKRVLAASPPTRYANMGSRWWPCLTTATTSTVAKYAAK